MKKMKNNSNLIKIGNFSKSNSDKDKPIVDYRFKIIYAISMLSVISDHCRGKASIEFNIKGWFPYSSYHMPLFMFAAGYFFKQKNVDSTFKYIIGKFKKLILRIYIYNFFTVSIYNF